MSLLKEVLKDLRLCHLGEWRNWRLLRRSKIQLPDSSIVDSLSSNLRWDSNCPGMNSLLCPLLERQKSSQCANVSHQHFSDQLFSGNWGILTKRVQFACLRNHCMLETQPGSLSHFPNTKNVFVWRRRIVLYPYGKVQGKNYMAVYLYSNNESVVKAKFHLSIGNLISPARSIEKGNHETLHICRNVFGRACADIHKMQTSTWMGSGLAVSSFGKWRSWIREGRLDHTHCSNFQVS